MSVDTVNDPSQDRGPVVLIITIAFLCASTVFVLLRLISRAGILKRVSWDDYFIIVAWFLAFGFSFSICWGVRAGLGHHEANIPPASMGPLRKAEYAFSVLYNPVLMATKTSILVFYLTLGKNQKVFRYCTYATLFVVNVAGLALTLVNIFRCHPITAGFDTVADPLAQCTDIVVLYLSSSPVNISTDIAILFLPMPILTSMILPRKQKIILIITFSFGVFVAVVDIIRIAYLQSAFQISLFELGMQIPDQSGDFSRGDFSWYASYSFMWSAIEVQVGIMCACVPALKPLATRILPGILRDTSNENDVSRLHVFSSGSSEAPKKEVVANDMLPTMNGAISTVNGAIEVQRPDPMPQAVKTSYDDMDMLDFLTTPETAHEYTRQGTDISTMTKTETGGPTFYGFVDINDKKSMVKLTNRESYLPLALVTILFFMWGFAYGLLAVLNGQFQLVVKMSSQASIALHALYYVGYFVAPLTYGRFILIRYGFKATFMTGLCVYGLGTLIYWPASVLTSSPAFLLSNFVVGMGLATLEVAANPFIVLCGPPERAETRLGISQGVQAIGSVVSPLLAQKVFFKNVNDGPSLVNTQWAYLGIALFDVALAIIFYYLPIPEASDEDFEEVAELRHDINSKQIFGIRIVNITLVFGIFSMFCYVGAQEAMAQSFESYITIISPNSAIGPFNWLAVGHTAFAVGRFLCAALEFLIKPRWVLLALFVGMIVTSVLAMNLTEHAGIAVAVLFLFFESGVFPQIFAISLRGLGRHTKTGSAFLTAAISGGAVVPVILNPVVYRYGLKYALCVIVAVTAFGMVFPTYLNAVPAAKKQVDPVHEDLTQLQLPISREYGRRDKVGVHRRINHVLTDKILKRRRKTLNDFPTVEHVEGGDKEMRPG